MLPSISSLTKICEAFDITISQFFLDDNKENIVLLNDKQIQLLKYAAKLDPEQFDALLLFLEKL